MENTTKVNSEKNHFKKAKKWLGWLSFCMMAMISIQSSAQLWDIQDCLPSTLGTNVYGPMRSTTNSSATSRTAVIYQSSLLTGIAGQELTSIYFDKVTSNDMTGTPHLKIYLKETTDPDFGSGSLSWSDAILGATLVYDSNPAPASAGPSGWKGFAFSNFFTYSGTQNLVLITEYVNTGNTVNTTWLYEYTNPCISDTNSNTTKYVNNTTGTPGDPLSTSNYRRPMIGFDFTVDCPAVNNLALSNVSSTGATFTWTPGGTETNWDYAVQPPGTGIPTSFVTTSSNPLNLTLTPQTHYEFYVRANCGGGDGESVWEGPYVFQTNCTNQLAGTYTIGATGDFVTLSDAVDALNTCGVSAPVTFNVLTGSGPYNEQLTITEFMGASATNTVTFNGNSETLTASTVAGSRSLFLLDGADYVTINDFNLVTIEDENNFVVQLINNADNNTITNNTIDMTSTMNSTSTTNAGIVVGGSLTSATAITDSGSDNSITGNTIIGGYYGINVNGQSATRSMNNVVSNNTLKDFYSYGISLRHNNNANVTNNEISRPDRVIVSTFYGIYFASGGEGNMASENNIHTPFGGLTTTSTTASYGIYHTANDAPVGNENTVINNIIHLSGNNGTIYGFYNSSSDGVHYFHNTVVLDDANSTDGITRGFYQTTTADNIELKNNIFSILRTGSGAKYCLYFNSSTSTIVSDHNVLYMGATDGTTGIGYSGSAQTTLSDWQTATSGDANSVDVDPRFANRLSSDFMPTNSAVNNIGTPVGVTTDYSGNPRNATTPDPGVYEFTPPSCPQPTALFADNLLATSADLSWTENGTATAWSIEWGPKGFIPTEIPNILNATNPQSLGGLTALTEYDFYVRANCGPGDESTWVGPYTFKTDCPGPLAGSYTVGAAGDFATLSDVAYALNRCGISATTSFNVLPGSGPYNEQIILQEIVGASATNTIAINGNGETLTAATVSASRSLILLDGTDYTTIVNFNLVTQSPTNNFVIQMTNNADHNVITNNTIDMASTIDETGSTNAGIVVSGSLTSATSTTGNSGTDNVIAGNTIVGGYYGISICGQSSTPSLNNIITNNTVKDFYSYGISLRYANDNVVANNDISRPDRNTVTTFYGVYYASGGEGNVTSANKLHTPFGSGASTSANYGIYHSSNDAPVGNESLVINNLVHLTGNDGSIYALYNSSSDGVHYYHNTIVLDDATATSGLTRGFHQVTTASNIELKNNVFSITRTGSGTKYCLYFSATASSIVSNNNVLHMGSIDGTTAIGYSGSAQTTLADWQTATAGDANSVDSDPLFANPLSSDFSPTNPAVNNIGTPVGVTTDINGITRDAATPDPGAYEFTPPSCPQPSSIQAPSVTITTADLIWQENGSAIQWEVEYGLEGFTQGSGTVVTDNDGIPGMTLSPLTGNTAYDVYVRAICAVGDESTWSGPFSFTTACGVLAAPYLMDFEASMTNTPNCWEISSSVTNGWTFATSPSNGNTYNDHTTGSGYFAFAESSSTYTPDATMTSPFIDMSGVTFPKLEFYKYHYDANPALSNTLTVEVHDGVAWNVVHFDNNGDVDAWEKVEIDLTTLTITGPIQARFIVDATVGSNFYNDIGIDDILFTGILPCADPSAIVISAITDSGAAISWTENGTATEWEIEYGSTGFVQGTGTIVNDNDGTLGETLSGLDDNTGYDVYVRAICSATNMSAWVGPQNFTTLVTPCADPSAIVVSAITDSGAAISWTENGTATEWEIEYGTTGFVQGTGTVVSDNDGTLGESLSGLAANTGYDVYVRAICSATNMSAWVGPQNFTTLVTLCADPSAIVVSAITDSGAAISWTENGTATEWEIEYGTTGFVQGTGTVVSDNDGTLGESLSGLADNTGYDVYVRAICLSFGSTMNASAWVGPVSFTTLVTPCVIPTAIVFSNITDSSAEVSWTENGTATEWEIEYGLAGFTQGSGTVVTDNDGTLGETLSGLADNTGYDVYIRAICSATNMSAWVGPQNFTTLVTPCADPSAIVVSNITDSSADVVWTENGTATEWEIEYGLTGFTQGTGTVVNDNDGTLGETLSGLTDATTYDVYVRAICSSTNASGWSGPETFTTDTKINVGDHDFQGFGFYPNPMEDVINISSQNERYELTIFNVVGQKMLNHKMESNTATIDVSHFASGTYLMQVVSETGKMKFLKLIKE